MHGGGYAWWGVCMAGGHAWQAACVAGETAIAAHGTHPTGMHSCCILDFVCHFLESFILFVLIQQLVSIEPFF